MPTAAAAPVTAPITLCLTVVGNSSAVRVRSTDNKPAAEALARIVNMDATSLRSGTCCLFTSTCHVLFITANIDFNQLPVINRMLGIGFSVYIFMEGHLFQNHRVTGHHRHYCLPTTVAIMILHMLVKVTVM